MRRSIPVMLVLAGVLACLGGCKKKPAPPADSGPAVAPVATVAPAAKPRRAVFPTIPPPTTGPILCQYWRELPGSEVADLLKCPAYPALPHDQTYLDKFEIPENQENDFGTVVSGYVRAPATGDYTFLIAGDNQAELWLSTDETPAHKAKIASVPEWSNPKTYDAAPEQASKSVKLEAGRKYYIEARHKDGGGDNNLSVAWKLPDGTTEAPIPGNRLSPAPAATVPAPKLILGSKTLPDKPGRHRIAIQVDYLAQQFTVPILLTIPENYRAGSTPLLVFLPDTEPDRASPDADGFLIQGPDVAFEKDAKLRAAYPFVIITPQCPKDRKWEQRVVTRALAAIIADLSSSLGCDPDQRYLTGTGSGGTEVWRLAREQPGFWAAVMPICGLEVTDPTLPGRLAGTRILITAGYQNGFAAECANRMAAALDKNDPKPVISWEDMGSEVADFAYTQGRYWDWLLDRKK